MNDLGGLLSSIFTGAIGLNQLVGGGGSSVSGSAAAGAAAADPFASQRGQYQQVLQGLPGQLQGQIGAAQGAVNPIIAQLAGIGGTGVGQQLQSMFGQPQQMLGGLINSVVPGVGTLQGQIDALASNYMDNPAIRAQYEMGLNTVERGLARSGLMGSGAQMVELEKFGQQFASNAYQQQFQNLLSGAQANAALAGQQFSQQAIAQQMLNQMNQQRFGQGLSLQQMLAQSLGQAGNLQLGASGQQLGATGNLLQQMLTASGATTGQPGVAGGILSGQFANSQQAAANLGQGLTGTLSRLLGGDGSGFGLFGNLAGRAGSSLLSGGGWGDLISGISPGLAGALGDMFGMSIGGVYGPATQAGLDALIGSLGFNTGSAAAAGAGTAGATGGAGATSGLGGLASAAGVALPAAVLLGGVLSMFQPGTQPIDLANFWQANAGVLDRESFNNFRADQPHLDALIGLATQNGQFNYDLFNTALQKSRVGGKAFEGEALMKAQQFGRTLAAHPEWLTGPAATVTPWWAGDPTSGGG